MDAADILERLRAAASQRLLFLPHAIRQMSHPDRMIIPDEVQTVLATGEILEDYPEDVRGHSCLLFGFGEDRIQPTDQRTSKGRDNLEVHSLQGPDGKGHSSIHHGSERLPRSLGSCSCLGLYSMR